MLTSMRKSRGGRLVGLPPEMVIWGIICNALMKI